jgi:hypothetical protein
LGAEIAPIPIGPFDPEDTAAKVNNDLRTALATLTGKLNPVLKPVGSVTHGKPLKRVADDPTVKRLRGAVDYLLNLIERVDLTRLTKPQ